MVVDTSFAGFIWYNHIIEVKGVYEDREFKLSKGIADVSIITYVKGAFSQ
jgi:hypothetical protein